MDGRFLLDISRELAAGSTEAHWRSSVGRAYYALLHEVLGALARWGFALPPRDKVHSFARLKFIYATHPDLKRIGLPSNPSAGPATRPITKSGPRDRSRRRGLPFPS
jgi:hypothetical protein